MDGVAENGVGAELFQPCGSATDYREVAAERVGWEMALSLTGGRTSITRRQNTVAQFITTRPLLDLCEGTTQRGEERVTMRWWDQKGINWEKAKKREAATEFGVRIGGRRGRGGDTGLRQQGKRLEWGGMEWIQCRQVERKLVNILHKERV